MIKINIKLEWYHVEFENNSGTKWKSQKFNGTKMEYPFDFLWQMLLIFIYMINKQDWGSCIFMRKHWKKITSKIGGHAGGVLHARLYVTHRATCQAQIGALDVAWPVHCVYLVRQVHRLASDMFW